MGLFEQIRMEKCRLCHSKTGQYDLKTDKKLRKEIYECTRIKVRSVYLNPKLIRLFKINDKCTDLLPRSVCEECKNSIQCFYLFKQQLRRVDQCFRRILKNIDSKSKDSKAEENFKCDKCPGEFNDSDLFKNHLKSHCLITSQEETKRDVFCPKCDNIFSNLDEYSSHNCAILKKTNEDFSGLSLLLFFGIFIV